jgi:hypothetical protein
VTGAEADRRKAPEVGAQFASSLSQNRICLSEFEVVFLIDHVTLELMLADRRIWVAVL